MINRMICGVLMSLSIAAMAQGADLFYMDHDPFTDKFVGPVGPLVLSGVITPGDYDLLLAKIAEDAPRFLRQNKIILALDDGDATESIKVANLIKSLFTEISVGPRTGRCVGACFLIYLAATQRATDGEHLVGIFRPSMSVADAPSRLPAHAPIAENKVLEQVHAFVLANDLPAGLAEEMFRRSPNDVYWLTEQDEAALGTRSPAFRQYLVTQCAWDETIEREVLERKRPIEDLKTLWACRARVTQPVARKALAAALKDKAARDSVDAASIAPR